MKQGFISPVLTYPFLTSTPTNPVDLTEKSTIYPIMKGLQGFGPPSSPQIIVSSGFNGLYAIIHVFQSYPEVGAPGTAAEGTPVVLTGDVSTLEFTFPNPMGKQ